MWVLLLAVRSIGVVAHVLSLFGESWEYLFQLWMAYQMMRNCGSTLLATLHASFGFTPEPLIPIAWVVAVRSLVSSCFASCKVWAPYWMHDSPLPTAILCFVFFGAFSLLTFWSFVIVFLAFFLVVSLLCTVFCHSPAGSTKTVVLHPSFCAPKAHPPIPAQSSAAPEASVALQDLHERLSVGALHHLCGSG